MYKRLILTLAIIAMLASSFCGVTLVASADTNVSVICETASNGGTILDKVLPPEIIDLLNGLGVKGNLIYVVLIALVIVFIALVAIIGSMIRKILKANKNIKTKNVEDLKHDKPLSKHEQKAKAKAVAYVEKEEQKEKAIAEKKAEKARKIAEKEAEKKRIAEEKKASKESKKDSKSTTGQVQFTDDTKDIEVKREEKTEDLSDLIISTAPELPKRKSRRQILAEAASNKNNQLNEDEIVVDELSEDELDTGELNVDELSSSELDGVDNVISNVDDLVATDVKDNNIKDLDELSIQDNKLVDKVEIDELDDLNNLDVDNNDEELSNSKNEKNDELLAVDEVLIEEAPTPAIDLNELDDVMLEKATENGEDQQMNDLVVEDDNDTEIVDGGKQTDKDNNKDGFTKDQIFGAKKIYVDKDTIILKKCFESHLRLADDNERWVYNELKNELLSYKDVHSRMITGFEIFRKSGLQAKLTIKGKSIFIYLRIIPENIDPNYVKVKDMSHKKAFEETPTEIRVSGKKKVNRCKELIAAMFEAQGIEKSKDYVYVDFAAEYPFLQNAVIFSNNIEVKE